jgi:hypothetical protein
VRWVELRGFDPDLLMTGQLDPSADLGPSRPNPLDLRHMPRTEPLPAPNSTGVLGESWHASEALSADFLVSAPSEVRTGLAMGQPAWPSLEGRLLNGPNVVARRAGMEHWKALTVTAAAQANASKVSMSRPVKAVACSIVCGLALRERLRCAPLTDVTFGVVSGR